MIEPTDPIAQLVAKWREQAAVQGLHSPYVHGWDSAKLNCADELEAIADALRAQRTEGRPMKFFVDGRGYDTTHPALNPMEIKQLAGVPLSDNLIAEGSIRQLMAEGKRRPKN